MKIQTDKADRIFSLYIRSRQGKCARCGKKGQLNKEGLPVIGLENSHYFGRGKESTRFDPDNCDALCRLSCHRIWGSDDRESYRAYMIKKLSQKGFDALTVRAYQYKKKDRKMEFIKWKKALKQL